MTTAPETFAELFRRRFAIVEEIQRLGARQLRLQQAAAGVDFVLMSKEAAPGGAPRTAEERARRAALAAQADEAAAAIAACEEEIVLWQARLDEIDRLIGAA
jgi:hypothetical protein